MILHTAGAKRQQQRSEVKIKIFALAFMTLK